MKYRDLGHVPEDLRIDQILAAVKLGRTVGVLVDDEPGKAERYISKVRAKMPAVEVTGPMAGPTRGVVTIKIGPPKNNN